MPPSCVTQQRALRPGATSISGGCSLHFAIRNGQRGAKRQPVGIAKGSGGAPSMVVRRRVCGTSRSIRGTALMSAHAVRRQTAMYVTFAVYTPPNPELLPFRAALRGTYTDFFAMFEVPFKYGGAASIPPAIAARGA